MAKSYCWFMYAYDRGCRFGDKCAYKHGGALSTAEIAKIQNPRKPGDMSDANESNRRAASPAPKAKPEPKPKPKPKAKAEGRRSASPAPTGGPGSSGSNSGATSGGDTSVSQLRAKFQVRGCKDFLNTECKRELLPGPGPKRCSRGVHASNEKIKEMRAANKEKFAKARDKLKASKE